MMPKKTDVKLVAMVAVGVIVAGYVMYMGRDIGVLADANRGFS